MKYHLDMTGKQLTVSKDPEPKNDQNGNQRSDKGTGRLMWSTQAIVLEADGASVISITTAGEKPTVTVGQPITAPQLEAMPWNTNGKNGVAFRATSLVPASAPAVSGK